MAENTKIEWAHHTFNPWEGCTKVGPGCDHCYAERRNNRFHGGNWGPGAPRRRTSPANWGKPYRWNRQAAELGKRYRVFCASLADVFDNEVDPAWRTDLFQLIRETPHLDWLLLTKRIGNVAGMLPDDWGKGWPNVWLGATVVNQAEADRDIPKLLSTPASLRWLSMEPLLGSVSLPWLRYGLLDQDAYDIIDWVVAGGESGPSARPMHPDWARSLRDQCAEASTPFLFKQWGEFRPAMDPGGLDDAIKGIPWYVFDDGASVCRAGKQRSGRQLDGQQHDGFPTSPAGGNHD